MLIHQSILKSYFKILGFGFALALTTTPISLAYAHSLSIGADVVPTWNYFEKDYGENNYKSYATDFNFYGTWRFCDYFGMEVGYELNTEAKRSETFSPETIVDGVTIPFDQIESYTTILKSKHTYFGLTAETLCLCKNFNIFGLIGISISRINASTDLVSITDIIFGDVTNANDINSYKKTKTIPMAKIGAKYDLCDFGIRATVTWWNISQFKTILSEENPEVKSIKPKDSFGLGLGLFYAFC